MNYLALTQGYTQCEYIITNPPWNRKILHPMIEHFADFKPTWLLFDADWMHTKQSTPYLSILKRLLVLVGLDGLRELRVLVRIIVVGISFIIPKWSNPLNSGVEINLKKVLFYA